MLSPKILSQKYWKFVNFSANFAKGGEIIISKRTPINPPIAEQSKSMVRANAPFSFLDNSNPFRITSGLTIDLGNLPLNTEITASATLVLSSKYDSSE